MQNYRNREEGWQYAKLTGHKNEELVALLTQENKEVQNRLLTCAHKSECSITKIEFGGLCEKNIDCIFDGEKTKSKTDMWLSLSDGSRLNVSIKKDTGGQAFLIGIDRFINGFEIQYSEKIPDSVKRALRLYFGSAEDTIDIIKKLSGKNKAYELRKHRLVSETLSSYDSNLSLCLINWFEKNINLLFDFCFAKGLAKNPEDWAQILWYKNLVGDNSIDTMIYLPDVSATGIVEYGTRTGGSTIQLPFGFVQWHSPKNKIPGNLQFHHNYDKIIKL